MTYQVAALYSTPDARDWRYLKSGPPNGVDYPDVVDRASDATAVEDQGKYPACVGNGACSDCEAIGKRNGLVWNHSRMFTYRRSQFWENLPPATQGTTIRGAVKSLSKDGVPGESLWPYNDASYNNPIPQSVMDAAASLKAQRYEWIVSPQTSYLTQEERIEHIIDAVANGSWVWTALAVSDSIRHLTGPWRNHQYQLLSPTVPDIGGHFLPIVGYDRTARKFKCLNSWGASYGDQGFTGMPFEMVSEFAFEALVMRKFAGLYNREAPGIRLEHLNFANIRVRIVPPVDQIGQTKKLWIVAKSPDNVWRYKPNLNVNAFAAVPVGPVPHCAEITLQDTNDDIYVLRDFDLFGNGIRPFAGWDVYCGIGDEYDLNTMTYAKVLTVPNNL